MDSSLGLDPSIGLNQPFDVTNLQVSPPTFLYIPPQSLAGPTFSRFDYSYYYNGRDNQADIYSGTVVAESDRYTLGQLVDPLNAPTESGSNGLYIITGSTALFDNTGLNQVTVKSYYDAESARTVTPDTGFGFSGLGSETGSLNPLLRPQDRFGRDRLEADLWDTRPLDPIAMRGKQSGNGSIDALLSEAVFHWNTSQNGGVITYSFYDAISGDYGTSEVAAPVSEEIKFNVRDMLAGLEGYLNVEFVEVPDSAVNPGVLRYLYSIGPDGPFYAYAYYPGAGSGGDVHLSQRFDADRLNSFSGVPGSYGYKSLLHETLHALGLKHPGRYNISGVLPEPPYLDPNLDHIGNSIMSYNGGGMNPVTPMVYDVAALQYLYGKSATALGNTTYRFNAVASYDVLNNQGQVLQTIGNPTQFVKRSIFDGGGTDTLDFSQLQWATAQRIDLRPGGIITYRTAYQSQSYSSAVDGETYKLQDYGTTIAGDTLFERLIASKGNDEIYANRAANTFMGYRSGVAAGNDVIDLGDCSDVVVLEGYDPTTLMAQQEGKDLLILLGMDGTLRLRNYYESVEQSLGCFTPLPDSLRVRIAGQDYAYYPMAASWIALPPTTEAAQPPAGSIMGTTSGLSHQVPMANLLS
jgi:Peptidase M10 serralysin C terminal